ncbi:MAG: hypothetical protein WCX22_08240, partial [Methanoregula sp.]
MTTGVYKRTSSKGFRGRGIIFTNARARCSDSSVLVCRKVGILFRAPRADVPGFPERLNKR